LFVEGRVPWNEPGAAPGALNTAYAPLEKRSKPWFTPVAPAHSPVTAPDALGEWFYRFEQVLDRKLDEAERLLDRESARGART
jgi:hypothetical protein